jgi:phospholipase/carboxylesterase
MSACLIARLLDTLDALGTIAQRMHPPQLEALVAVFGDRGDELRAASAGAVWSEELVALRDAIERAVGSTLHACDGLRAAVGSPDGLRQVFRALRQVSRAQEALYPAAAVLPSVSSFFLEPERQDDQALLDRLMFGAARTDVRTGVTHTGNDTNERGGFSVYVPEGYDPARAHPLVMALHGGSGHGRLFLWSWVREARDVVADGPRVGWREFGKRAGTDCAGLARGPDAPAADRHERRRHVHAAQRIG